ncbi:unnamed protein product [Lampetra fluviatilis]
MRPAPSIRAISAPSRETGGPLRHLRRAAPFPGHVAAEVSAAPGHGGFVWSQGWEVQLLPGESSPYQLGGHRGKRRVNGKQAGPRLLVLPRRRPGRTPLLPCMDVVDIVGGAGDSIAVAPFSVLAPAPRHPLCLLNAMLADYFSAL